MRIPGKIPGKLSIRGAGVPIFTGGSAAYNYAIGGLPFLSAASELDYGKRKIRRATAPFRKTQTDDQVNPGEHSLDGFWIRSQVSFHDGAGLLYSDPGENSPKSSTRFWRSKNVDPWTQGSVSLLSRTNFRAFPGLTELISITFGNGVPGVAGIRSNQLLTKAVGQTAIAAPALPAAITSVTTSGPNIYVSTADGLYRGAVPANPGVGVTAWVKQYNYTVTRTTEVAWVKERIVLGVDSNLYELAPVSGAAVALPAAIYTAKAENWTWTSITETSSAIYALGSAGSVSSILKFVLETDGGIPTLTFGSVACTLPGGEVAHAVYGYLGQFVGIGTNKGVRVAVADTDGNLRYGPLIFETALPVLDFTGRDRWLWCGYSETADTGYKLARIDLSAQIEELRFAYATDISADNDPGNVLTVAFYGSSDVLGFATSGFYHEEDKTHRAASGFLQTSRIRFSTLEPKVFRSIRVRGPKEEGNLGVSVVDVLGAVTPINVYGVNTVPGEDDITIPSPALRDFLSLRFDFNASADGTAGAVMHGWQVKALPGSPRQRMITLPLWCFDWEKDRHGQRVGGHRTAARRLLRLENLEATSNVVQFQDLDLNITHDVFIEQLEFEQSDPPPRFEGWGGLVFIQMRTV